MHSYKNAINTNSLKNRCLLVCDTTQTFEMEISVGNELYYYFLELDYFGIVNECLWQKKSEKQKYKTILEAKRTMSNRTCNQTNGNYEECTAKECHGKADVSYEIKMPDYDKSITDTLKNTIEKQKQIGLFITQLSILGYEPAVQFTDWVKNRLLPETNSINYDLYMQMKREEDNLHILNNEKFLEIFQMVDGSIIEIEIDEEKPYTKTKVIRRNANGMPFSRELSQDSSGVREFFAWSVQIYKVVYENAVVFADEMDRVLNPILSDRVIAFINGKEHHGQFVFTTHNVLHLDLKNYMKEQIYFITKDVESIESELYSLADFPEIRYETTKIYEFYMKGILGGTAFE